MTAPDLLTVLAEAKGEMKRCEARLTKLVERWAELIIFSREQDMVEAAKDVAAMREVVTALHALTTPPPTPQEAAPCTPT